MDFVTMSDGARLATWTQPGPSDAPEVILVHGGPGLWDNLAPLGELMADRATVRRYDQRRCGSSTGPQGETADGSGGPGSTTPVDPALAPADVTMERSIQDIEELREAFGHERVIVIGHSFGATLALAYAGTHPERTAALGYVSGVGIGDWRAEYRPEKERRLAPWADRFAELSSRDRTAEEEIQWRRIQWATDYADPQAAYEGVALEEARSPHTIHWMVNRALVSWGDAEQIAWAQEVTCPAFFVHGTADPRPVGPVVALSRHAPVSRRRAIVGAGHSPWVEDPGQMRETLAEIIASAGMGAGGSGGADPRPTFNG